MEEIQTHHYIAQLDGTHWGHLEDEEQAFVRRLMRVGYARIVDKRVQIRNASDTGYKGDYKSAVKGAALALGVSIAL